MNSFNLKIIIISILLISLFVVVTNTYNIKAQTCPARAGDYDSDGLKDEWEKNGIDINNDKIIDLDLKKLGAKYDHKDLFVEVDYMKGFKPSMATFPIVEKAFKDASLVCNPDNARGVNLHIQVDQQIPHVEIIPWSKISEWKNKYFGTTSDSNVVKEAKKQVFHYSFFIDKYREDKTSTGKADTPGMNSIVSLGVLKEIHRTPSWQAKTFMHEVGHNLHLYHGGWDKTSFKPNYFSVMNYFFQSPALSGTIDYASCKAPKLKEYALDESQGVKIEGHVCKQQFPITAFFQELVCSSNCSGKLPDYTLATKIPTNSKYDFDRSGSKTVTKYDLNCDKIKTDLSNDPNTDWLQLKIYFH